MSTKTKTAKTTTADRLEALRLQVNAAIAEAGAAREAADALTYRVRDGQTVSTEEWTTLPAAAAMANVKLGAIREAYEQERTHAEREQVQTFVKGARERLTREPQTDDRLAELGAYVKTELDKIIVEIDAYNAALLEIHDEAREPGTRSGSSYGTRTRPVVQEHGMYVDQDFSGKFVRIDGEEFRELGALGLVDDVAHHVRMLDTAA
ncbi:hypothetical protein CIK75_02515 [Glutamicibacter sp. BW78]|uniref:hypothetical protein n=1 Tax=Glutamicibacter sp. BW78 TaxID=2024403 RepID=UPI000BB6DA2E|nr:hypothetical protein [Glutamicibacter sp. BW78]PCC26515.1 hypothetical protein CIK75_02515 [Glutamicibacter sp. BW78]